LGHFLIAKNITKKENKFIPKGKWETNDDERKIIGNFGGA